MNNFVVKITSDIELWNLVRYLNVLRSRQHWKQKHQLVLGYQVIQNCTLSRAWGDVGGCLLVD